jgi:cobalamin synthase
MAAVIAVYTQAWRPAIGVMVVTLGVGLVARSRIGGVTGDVLGAGVELGEAAALVGAEL